MTSKGSFQKNQITEEPDRYQETEKKPGYLQNRELVYNTLKNEQPDNELLDKDFFGNRKKAAYSSHSQKIERSKKQENEGTISPPVNIRVSQTSDNFYKKAGATKPNAEGDKKVMFASGQPMTGFGGEAAKDQQAQTIGVRSFDRIGRLLEYKGEEDEVTCARFPHLKFCACSLPTEIALKEIRCLEVHVNLYLGPLPAAFNTRELLQIGITHILNVSSEAYTKRKYFEYLNIDVYDNHEEDIKKYFRISNRFIKNAVQKGGKVLVHSSNGKSRGPAFILAYFISNCKINLKKGMDQLKAYIPDLEINHNFYKQLEIYDLEKLALLETSNQEKYSS